MPSTPTTPNRRAENQALRAQLEELHAENRHLRLRLARLLEETATLREVNGELGRLLEAHVSRARSAAAFGPLEMSAGTCIGPHRRRSRVSAG